MKRILLFWLLLLFTVHVQAQDLIIKNTGEEIKAKVLEISITDILYQLSDSAGSPTFSITKNEVFMIKYANGEKELIAATPAEENMDAQPLTPQQMYELGRRDAKIYYKGNGAMWGSAVSSIYTMLLGPIVIAAVPPKIKPTEVSEPLLLNDWNYVRGYKKQAHKRKIGKAATGTAIGVATIFIGTIILVSNHK
ncbi:hypothetical protein [Rufibacter roseus]|uniref:Uncharacterized protein n=1 Tax=Rufibacter roseus TaxID=1567108 RepID=A0ABW2DPY7_9BACT|nr:hypothetical protein [Rufibacter roseus]